MRPRLAAWLTLSALWALPTAGASADEVVVPPDEDFLEYLGSWDGDDEDWLVAAGARDAATPASPPATPPRSRNDNGGGRAQRPPQEQER